MAHQTTVHYIDRARTHGHRLVFTVAAGRYGGRGRVRLQGGGAADLRLLVVGAEVQVSPHRSAVVVIEPLEQQLDRRTGVVMPRAGEFVGGRLAPAT